MDAREVIEEVKKAHLEQAFSSDTKAKHFRILKRRNLESSATHYAIIGRSERVPGKKSPVYSTLMNLGRLSAPDDEQAVIDEVGLTEETVELIKTYFERKRLNEKIKEDRLDSALTESAESLERAREALK